MNPGLLAAGVAACVLLGAHLAAAEAVLGALGRLKLKQLGRRHAWLGRALEHPHDLQRILSLGGTLAIAGAAAMAAVMAEHVRAALGAPLWPGLALEMAVLLAVVLVAGDALPRAWVRREPERMLPLILPALRLAATALGPLARAIGRLAGGGPAPRSASPAPSAAESAALEELRTLADADAGVPAIEPRDRAMLQGAFRIRSTTAREIMTALPQLVMAEVHQPVPELLALVRANWHSRIPVYEARRDNVRGVLYAKDLLPFTLEADAQLAARALMREAYFAPANKQAEELLRDFQREHVHVAIVVSEYGAALGLVTLEDVVEEIVGEVRDEFDVEEPALRRLEDGSLLVRGEAPLADVQRQLGVDLAGETADTLEAYLLKLRPEGLARGEEVQVAGRARFRVERTAGRRIWSVRAQREEVPR